MASHAISHHVVSNADDLEWGRLETGESLAAAEYAGFNVLLTADKNLRHQQRPSGRRIAMVELGHSPWPLARLHVPDIAAAVNSATPASYSEGEIPLSPKKPFPAS
jgi:hypothetical protein